MEIPQSERHREFLGFGRFPNELESGFVWKLVAFARIDLAIGQHTIAPVRGTTAT